MKNKWGITQNIMDLSNKKPTIMEFNLLGCKLCENYELRFVEGLPSEVVDHGFICCVL